MDNLFKTQKAVKRGGIIIGVSFGLIVVGVGVAVGLPFVNQLVQMRKDKEARDALQAQRRLGSSSTTTTSSTPASSSTNEPSNK